VVSLKLVIDFEVVLLNCGYTYVIKIICSMTELQVLLKGFTYNVSNPVILEKSYTSQRRRVFK